MRDVANTVVDTSVAALAVARLKNAPESSVSAALAQLVSCAQTLVHALRPDRAQLASLIEFATEIGFACDDNRQEWVLLCDALGISMMVENLDAPSDDRITPGTITGPFYRPGRPIQANGSSISQDGQGVPMSVRLRVTDTKGTALTGARVEVWQANSAGLYENQDPDQQPDGNLRGAFLTDETGQVAFSTVKPRGYSLPKDGPVARLLQSAGLPLTRPAHLNFRISAEGFRMLTTHIYDANDPAIDLDPLFAVKPALCTAFLQMEDETWALTYTFVLAPHRDAVSDSPETNPYHPSQRNDAGMNNT